MSALGLIFVIFGLIHCSSSYSAYQQRPSGGYGADYTASSSSSFSSSSSSSSSNSGSYAKNCCLLNSWAYGHMDEIRQLANRLRREFNYMSQGSSTGYTMGYIQPWNANIIELTGKTGAELDALTRQLSEEIVTNMRKGLLTYTTIAQANFFEWKAAEALQALASTAIDVGQQQQQVEEFGHYLPVDLNNYDEVKNYNYPAEVKVIDGKTYVVHQNYTEASKTSGEGTFGNPLVTVLKRNRTVVTTNASPGYEGASYIRGSAGFPSSSMVTNRYPTIYTPQTSTGSTITRKQTIYDWVNKNMEPSVVGYNPIVNVNSEWSGKLNSYKPPVHIPVDTSFNSDIETFTTGSNSFRPSYTPGSTVTVRKYNKTIVTNADGTQVSGSEVNKKWVDGKLVYDSERPFGDWTVPRDEAWKRDERERLFWFLTQAEPSSQRLEAWQRQQEERLLGLADRYHTTIEQIQEWHKAELDRYRILQNQYHALSNDLTGWKRMERGRLDWLIHQNSVTREDLERWQRENQDRLLQLARQYRISLDELKSWQLEELNRLYVHFNDQNNSMITRPSSESFYSSEQQRLEELIRQHNATIEQLQNSIKLDQQKLSELSTKYRGNVHEMEQWLKGELARLGSIITDQRNEVSRITSWQSSERERLENILRQHRGSIEGLEAQTARDRAYIQSLAAKYHVSIEELEKWQQAELLRLQREGQSKLEMDIKDWQKREHEHLKSIITKNDLTIEEFQQQMMSDRARLENLASTYKLQVSEVEDWIRKEIKEFQSQGLLKEVEAELKLWQQKERERLMAIVQQSSLTVEELEKKIKNDQTHMYTLANTYQVRVEEIEEWLKKELLRLQSEGLIKAEDLKDWQKHERDAILMLVQQNRLTIEEFERKLLSDRQRLEQLAKTYNVQTSEIESWIKHEGERLQNLGMLQIQKQLNNWQKIERERLLGLITQNNLTISELEQKIKSDQVHLYSLAHQHQVRVEEIEEWIKQEIKKLQQEGLIEIEKLKGWQTEWRGNLTNLVRERDFTVEEFHKWLLEDRARLQALAMQHNVQIEEIEQWIHNEEQRFISLGLLKPNEKLTNWQEVERRYLERITQEQYHSTEQLEQRLRQDRELLEKLARDYSVQVEEIEMWMKKELARLRDDGQLQINNLTSWQIAERERLEQLILQNNQWSAEELEAVLRKDREHMQKMAFQYHTSVEEIEKWIQSEIERMRLQGKINIEQLTAWQKAEQQRILSLLQQQSSITVEEFERKVHNDRQFLMRLANQYHVSVVEVEQYVQKVIEELRQKGKFEVENLKAWQLVERDYIKQLIAQYNNGLSTAEFEEKLLNDRAHVRQLADQYRINVDQVEKWMIEELKRLRQGSEKQVQQLASWQLAEVQRIKDLIRNNQRLTYVEFEVQLMQERQRLQDLAKQYSLSVEQVEAWLRQQLINLKTTGEIQVENLTQWQVAEQKRLIDLLLQQHNNLSMEELEMQLRRDRVRLQQLAQQHSVSVEQIERWMREELQRLKDSGLVQVEQLTYWQRIERDRLQDWLNKQNNATTNEQFLEFLRRDKERLQRISQDYHVTVDEIEAWVRQEGARLQLLGHIKRPEKLIYVDEYHFNNNGVGDNMWKVHTRAHLQAIAQVRHMNWADFEKYLKDERMRWQQFARQYNITVEEIETWLRQAAQEMVHQGLIQGTITVEEWEGKEQMYIQNLISEKLLKQQQWSIEELERQLRNDRNHLQRLAIQYHITIEEIERWYKQELQRLLDQRRIISENLVDWQRREKERLFAMALRQPNLTIVEFERQILGDRNMLQRLGTEYHVTVEELEYWIRNEMKRLNSLGLIKDVSTNTSFNNWQQQERQRLRTIAADIIITEEEFVEYIAGDHSYQNQLARIYGCALDQLAPFQRIEIGVMQREGLLDNTKLLRLESWQKRERDRLYSLIKNQNFSLKNLKDWQRQDRFLNELAAKYGITVQVLKDWQIAEYERLMRLAEHYEMTLNQLQDFREKELRYIVYVMHKKTSSEMQRISWGANEAKRMEILGRKTGLSGEELLAWRRRLYLLSQGLLAMDFGGFGGHISGVGTTNRTAIPQQIISKDRGDQPPNIHEELMDGDEPGLAGGDPMYPPPMAEIRQTTPRPSNQYLPPPPSGGAPVQSGYRYTKKEYKFTVPAGGSSVPLADFDSGSSGMSDYRHSPTKRSMDKQQQQQEQQVEDFGQQQQQEVEDFGQQQQVDLSWNGQLIANGSTQQEVEDLGQQQQVDLSWNGQLTASDGNQQQQQEVEDFGQQQQVDLSLNGQLTASGGSQQQQQEIEDLGQQQQVDLSVNAQLTANVGSQQQQQQEVEDFGQQQQVDLSWNGQLIANGSTQQEVEDLGQQQQVDLSWNGQLTASGGNQQQQQEVEDLGQQQQVDLSWNGQLTASGGSQQQQSQLEDFGQQQVELEDMRQYDFGQQQVQVEDVGGSFTSSSSRGVSQKQVSAANPTPQVEVEAEAETEAPGFWGRLKQKTTNLFG